MPDDPNAGTGAQGGNTGAGAGAGGNTGGNPNPTPPAGNAGAGTGQDPETETFDKAYVTKLRNEAAANRTKAKELEERLKAIEEKDLTEQQKLAKRLEQIEKDRLEDQRKVTEAEQKLRQAEILSAVTTAGARKPAVVARLIDADATDLNKAIAAVKKDNPELFIAGGGAGSANAGAGTGGGATNTGGGGSARTPEEINREMNNQIRRMSGRNVG